MATVIDALLIDLGLDSSDFLSKSQAARADLQKTGDAGRKAASDTEGNVKRATDAAGKNAQQLEAWGKGAAESIGRLRDTYLGLVAAFTLGKGVEEFTVDTTQAEAATGRLAHNLRIPVKTLSEWQQVMATLGGAAEDANGSLDGIQKTMMQANMGSIPAAHTLSILGIRGNEDASTALIKASQFFQSHSGMLDDQIAAQAGISKTMEYFLQQGPAAVQQQLALAGPTAMTEQQTKDAEALQKAWGALLNTLDSVGRELLDDANPYLKAFLGHLQQFATWANNHPEKALLDVLGGLSIALVAAKKGFEVLVEWLAGPFLRRLLGVQVANAAAAAAGAQAAASGAGPEAVAAAASAAGAAALAAFAAGAILFTPSAADPGEEEELNKRYPNRYKGVTQPIANTDLPAPAKTLLNTIASGESGGDYAREYGSLPDMTSFADHPDVETTLPDGSTTSAAGRYQFEIETWKRLQKQFGLKDFSPKNQDIAAWQLAQETYRSQSGRDLLTDLRLRDPNVDAAIQKSLSGQWPSLAALSGAAFAQALGVPLAPPPAPPSSPHHSAITGRIAKLPEGLTNLLSKIKAPPPLDSSTAALIAHHSGLLSAAVGARANVTNHGPVNTHNHSSNEVSINGPINVTTQAKTPDGIARGLGDALKKHGLIAMGINRGLA